MDFANFVAVFGCSVVTDSISKMLGFSTVSYSQVILFGWSIGFNKLGLVLRCLTATDFMSPLLDVLSICLPLFFKNNS